MSAIFDATLPVNSNGLVVDRLTRSLYVQDLAQTQSQQVEHPPYATVVVGPRPGLMGHAFCVNDL
jgi:hypothetical protein